MFYKISLYCLLLFFIINPSLVEAQSEKGYDGKWILIPERSSEIGLFKSLSIEFKSEDSVLTIIQSWGKKRKFVEELVLQTGGVSNKAYFNSRVFPSNVFMGLSITNGSILEIKAYWKKNGKNLEIEKRYSVISSQGTVPIIEKYYFELTDHNDILICKITRSSRLSGPEIKYVFKREGTAHAWFMYLEDNWEIQNKLPEQAFLISLQGVVNKSHPRLYFIYPDNWDFRFTPGVFEYLKNERNYTFEQLFKPAHALNIFKEYVNGYVVWDKEVRTSLIVAFTVAGLENAVVISEDLIPLVERFGIKKIEDFRGKFIGKSDVEIYTWAYKQYWDRCSKEYIVWLGGEHGNILKPGVADFGISKKAFFNDLSTRETDIEEYKLADKLLSEMRPMSFVFGWHSYFKDKEREHVKLTSKYALRVEGLHTLPNMSFSCQIPASKGFTFKNNHNIDPNKVYKPKEKVYVSCIQTDCLGLGAWTKPGRGEIPYAWEVTMNWVWLAPAMMEYFYSQATPNDYFIGALSGPGYMYPKEVPPEYLPKLVGKAYELMKQLDLNVFEIMDNSEGATVEGNTELTQDVINVYYNYMPEAIGFVNGYTPSYTFTVKDKRPLISFDYYLSETRTEGDAVSDLKELATINSKRPYFLLVHVRQWSDISRVKSILDKLGPEFEVVPLDIFMKMAGEQPTFKSKLLEE